ncbi:MAG: 50S ribosomal protein L29 [Candidatus Brennerbacteria bacterium RIFOXYC1_FULL_41_11]|uniref:Large ribosomal subunit protein uL29 n=1 Tax=Candidatus Brennerbacteria bacterium RIFOXYD1_FULL_41_16 TaxID=1797529 RepID=A0A1G1XJS8_9BACT|nr:MAG: 50S ribosomal protein L29 [Parcubacteria group bacterium GW2011_GWB1_41_4]OGY38766.1 MAG: 50S ribosomal protein L29 [Candidatus Brennerbacteria bacterium RIFOXYB1_FULL_41_13]OGY39049.1 MAG: 50S ribosomal protein L29 [Candidatus Brennerbacteria bacterium RIFOXYC1_FULL_41_11]OGY40202.1 MAG: 50S ribosomal protein L29 [Candidatus Brennerbacteria bacterium RIFOXYD1_FULL_41_16]
MKTKTLKDFKSKTESELVSLLPELKKKLQEFSFGLKLGKLQNVSQISKTRRDIARIKMILSSEYGKKS